MSGTDVPTALIAAHAIINFVSILALVLLTLAYLGRTKVGTVAFRFQDWLCFALVFAVLTHYRGFTGLVTFQCLARP